MVSTRDLLETFFWYQPETFFETFFSSPLFSSCAVPLFRCSLAATCWPSLER